MHGETVKFPYFVHADRKEIQWEDVGWIRVTCDSVQWTRHCIQDREFLDTPGVHREFLKASHPCNKLRKQNELNHKEFTQLLGVELFHQPNLMHNFLYSLTCVCYTIILDMFRALTCPSSGGKIVFTQHLVSSFSVNVCTVHWLRAD